MRIACIYLPSFPLQVHVRNAPHLAGKSVAVTSASERPTIIACSRQAWDQGVRVGMSATQARAIAPDLTILPGDPQLYQNAAQSLGESLLPHSLTIDIGAGDPPVSRHKAIYLHVPKGSRGSSFGTTLLTDLDRQGFRGRIGIADDRFTAWAAAAITPTDARPKESSQLDIAAVSPGHNPSFVQTTKVVPRGGAAAFLCPLPLELLPLEDEIRNMLHTLGIHTLGDFAALPPPSVGKRWDQSGVDYQALARGDGPTVLTGLIPGEDILEAITCDHEISEVEPLSFLLRPVIDRACERLRGRGLAAGEVALILSNEASQRRTQFLLAPSRPTLSPQTLLDLLRAKLSEKMLEHSVTCIQIEVTRESEPEVCELDLFDHRDAEVSADAVDVAIARLQAALGNESVHAAELVDTHRPESAFKLTPFTPPRRERKRTKKAKARRKKQPAKRASQNPVLPMVLTGMVGALRLLDPPRPQPTDLRAIDHDGATHKVVASHGPTKLETEWWNGNPASRDYYEIETDDGGRYWVFKEKNDGRYYLHGIFD